MKYLLITLLLLTACEYDNVKTQYIIDGGKYNLVIVEGCEYFSAANNTSITHKGNCKNPIHLSSNH